jgi:hypothetical protein
MQLTVMAFLFTSLTFSPFPFILMRTSSHFSFMPFIFSAHPFIMRAPTFTFVPIPLIPVPVPASISISVMAVNLYYSLWVIIM